LDLVCPHYIIVSRLSAHAGIGDDLYHCLMEAIPEWNKHAEQLVTFSASLSTTILGRWQQMVSVWDANHDQPNPYEIGVTGEDRVHWSMKTMELMVGLMQCGLRLMSEGKSQKKS